MRASAVVRNLRRWRSYIRRWRRSSRTSRGRRHRPPNPPTAGRRPPCTAARTRRGVLRALIRVVDHLARPPLADRHVQGVEDELRPGAARHRPAHDLAREGVEQRGRVKEARPGRDVGDVARHRPRTDDGRWLAPEPVGRRCRDDAVDQIGRGPDPLVADRRAGAAPPADARPPRASGARPACPRQGCRPRRDRHGCAARHRSRPSGRGTPRPSRSVRRRPMPGTEGGRLRRAPLSGSKSVLHQLESGGRAVAGTDGLVGRRWRSGAGRTCGRPNP
jgi:hypothetical protein